jgi:hypothetical protein
MSWVADHDLSILSELRIVTRDDFYDSKGKKIYPEVFFIHSFAREDVIEEHKPNGKGYDWTRWRVFSQNKRMYVKK